jgi:hypothetical protein
MKQVRIVESVPHSRPLNTFDGDMSNLTKLTRMTSWTVPSGPRQRIFHVPDRLVTEFLAFVNSATVYVASPHLP